MEPFQRQLEQEGPALFRLERWEQMNDGLTVGFTGRAGGCSSTPYLSLNCGLHVGDKDADVISNRQSIASALGWPFDAWTCAEQVHGNVVHQVKLADRGRGRADHADAIAGADAIMTDVSGVLLASYYADCVPLYFYDRRNNAIALAHAGWRGTAGEIAAATVSAMEQAYGSQPNELLAAIGPAIGLCCYEVDGPVLQAMEPLINEAEAAGARRDSMVGPLADGRAAINLKEINRQIMIKAGIMPSNIELTKWCTSCSQSEFYSYRAEQGRTGRMASWIGMAEEVEGK